MKIKTSLKELHEVLALPKAEHLRPKKPNRIMQTLMRSLATKDLKDVDFTYETVNMEKAGNGPWMILMNHSSFLDLEIASKLLYPRPYHIVCTSDGFVGKEKLMRSLGCIPTQKFLPDITLISDIKYALRKNNTSVLMYPEASYSFDGTATPLPRRMGVFLKALKVPVVMITTFGAFARDPLYNNLQKRKVKVSARMECLLSASQLQEQSVEEIDALLDEAFSFDYFLWQAENKVEIREPFRADGLNRILYRCPHCQCEGQTEGKGTVLVCRNCGKEYEMDLFGRLQAKEGESAFTHVPDWYAWERQTVKEEIEEGRYCLDTDVKIGIIIDTKALYMVGHGRLHHDKNGFVLDGCDGLLHYEQGPTKCYSLYSDYYWYEIGDVICIGDKNCLYYCFPEKKDVVAKARIATEELFKLAQPRKSRPAKNQTASPEQEVEENG